eukprot:TRINITY_DN59571_c0_g1_i1.p1 TRINITY_DN59571_c0_g1~~TRINITY_DN59571_c0_g1_i1.p1  ORF type:complete len:989 (-),score=220.50 TRINITY_DN59571_c0_g1_i1:124-3057(-)
MTAGRQVIRAAAACSSAQSAGGAAEQPDPTNAQELRRAKLVEKKDGRHRKYFWVSTSPGFEDAEMDVSDIINSHGVPKDVLVDYIEKEINDEESFKSLPFALSLIILFAMMFQSHDRTLAVHGIEEAIDFDLEENAVFAFSHPGVMGHKDLHDINSYADFWSWLGLGIIPLLFPDTVAVSESAGDLSLGKLSAHDQLYYLWHNRKVGGLRLQQERSVRSECSNVALQKAYGQLCSSDAQGIRANLMPEEFDIVRNPIQPDDAFTIWMRYNGTNSTMTDQIARAKSLELSRWIDETTARVELSFVLYNGPKDILALNTVSFIFARSGHIWKRLTHRSIVMNPYLDPTSMIFDILFYGQLTWIFLSEAREVCGGLREQRWNLRKFLKGYLSVWNTVDWVSISLGYIMLGLWVYQNLATESLAQDLSELEAAQDACLAEGDMTHCDRELDDFFTTVQWVGNYVKHCREFCAFYPIVIMLRLFKAFSAQPRLALVTDTLAKASSDLFHFSIIFLSIFMSFAVMGTIVFGRELPDFTTVSRTTVTLFNALMGEFDVDTMRVVGRWKSFLFFASFMISVLFVMLDMLVGLLMDTYEAVKRKAQTSETLLQQATEMFSRAWQNRFGGRMSLSKVRSALVDDAQANDSEGLARVDDLMDMIPGLKEGQAITLLEEAASSWATRYGTETGAWEVMGTLVSIYDILKGASSAMARGVPLNLNFSPMSPDRSPDAVMLQPMMNGESPMNGAGGPNGFGMADHYLKNGRLPTNLRDDSTMSRELMMLGGGHDPAVGSRAGAAMEMRKADLQAQNMRGQLPRGTIVTICRLVGKPEDNGKRGTILIWLHEAGKYRIKLDDGRTCRIKPDNLEVELQAAPPRAMTATEDVALQLQEDYGSSQILQAAFEASMDNWRLAAKANGRAFGPEDLSRQVPLETLLLAAQLQLESPDILKRPGATGLISGVKHFRETYLQLYGAWAAGELPVECTL